MVALINSQEQEIVMRIFDACSVRAARAPRDYLGMSLIGEECERKLWLKVHGAREHPLDGRIARVFDMGNAVEVRVKADFREANFVIDGEQLEFTDFSGRFRGHCDGIIKGITQKDHILEIKSANDESFKKFRRQGIKSRPIYYDQVQCYMGYSKLERALFVVENKNNQELYLERVYFDRSRFEELKEKAQRILTAEIAPDIQNKNCDNCEYVGPACQFADMMCENCKHYLTLSKLETIGYESKDDICVFHVKQVLKNNFCESFLAINDEPRII
jgi:hypothetical protein